MNRVGILRVALLSLVVVGAVSAQNRICFQSQFVDSLELVWDTGSENLLNVHAALFAKPAYQILMAGTAANHVPFDATMPAAIDVGLAGSQRTLNFFGGNQTCSLAIRVNGPAGEMTGTTQLQCLGINPAFTVELTLQQLPCEVSFPSLAAEAPLAEGSYAGAAVHNLTP